MLDATARMTNDVNDQPAKRLRLNASRRPKVSATPPDSQITASRAAGIGPTSVDLSAQTKNPKPIQPPR